MEPRSIREHILGTRVFGKGVGKTSINSHSRGKFSGVCGSRELNYKGNLAFEGNKKRLFGVIKTNIDL